jgi:hypothetical protein
MHGDIVCPVRYRQEALNMKCLFMRAVPGHRDGRYKGTWEVCGLSTETTDLLWQGGKTGKLVREFSGT